MRTLWHKGALTYGEPKVMGILNVTPDSFSDGGRYAGKEAALKRAFEMIDEGADIIDIGGESTRPGSSPVSAEEEIARVVPVLKELIPSVDVPVSVDTMKTDVAIASLSAGADIINDVNGLRADGMIDAIASAGVPAVIMHMHGTPDTMHDSFMRGDYSAQIVGFLKERKEAATDAGIKDIILDPGVGFGKTKEQNIGIIDNASLYSLGCPVLIGASRKRFLRDICDDVDEASTSIALRAVESGADIVRVHNVAGTVKALRRKF